jgi:hypothetical protein
MLIFTEGEKPENPENPEKNPRGKGENICSEQESNPDHSGERRALTHYATHTTHDSRGHGILQLMVVSLCVFFGRNSSLITSGVTPCFKSIYIICTLLIS